MLPVNWYTDFTVWMQTFIGEFGLQIEQDRFEKGAYLYDVIDGEAGPTDDSCRPNQVLAIVCVGIVIFEMKKPQRRFHGYFFLTLPGGGSLMTAQNTPSSLMASTN